MDVPSSAVRQSAPCLLVMLASACVLLLTAGAGITDERSSWVGKLRYGPGVSNHPVQVVPSAAIRVPDGWPVDVDGSITCRTCHEELPSLDGGADARLRDFDAQRAEPSEFCTKCHTQGAGNGAAAIHWQAVGVAHVKADDVSSGSRGRALDRQTTQCLGCHDGVNAVESRNPTPWNRGRGYAGDGQRNHPVGVEYPDRTPRGSSVPFRPVSLLPEQVVLPEGKVGCVSCHDLYSEKKHLLTVTIEGSELCFTCHDLK